ncbi:MAG: hypothetical protein KGP06_02165 [Acidobacteria bacterium]|nr:hypothetical protein [Acidobacteriota bacterium]
MLALFAPPPEPLTIPKSHKLYLVPTTFGDEFDPDFAPQPSSLAELPDIEPWLKRFVVSLLEIWIGQRAPQQLSRWCHRAIYQELIRKIGSINTLPKVRNIYRCQPIEGVEEVTVTLRFGDRIRSLVIRFEGVDKRWLCTELFLI